MTRIRMSADALDALDTLTNAVGGVTAAELATDVGWDHGKAGWVLRQLVAKMCVEVLCISEDRGKARRYVPTGRGLAILEAKAGAGMFPGGVR